MKKTIVIYYSNTGSNKYLAERFAKRLDADIEAIQPRLNAFIFLLISSFTKLTVGIRPIKHHLEGYERVVLCGPIWTGQFITPLRCFVKKYKNQIKNLYFATCCGSTDVAKADKFGYATVFPKVKALFGDKNLHCEAFPIALVLPEDKMDDGEAMMKTRLSDENFNGKILERFDNFINTIMA